MTRKERYRDVEAEAIAASVKHGVDHRPDEPMLKTRTLPRGPWVYKKMILFPTAKVGNGSWSALRGKDGDVVAHGFLNRKSEISFRVLGGPKDSDLGELLTKRFTAAHDLRTKVLGLHQFTNGARIIHGEADGCPGLIVDRYNRTLVVLAYALGWVANAELVESVLRRLPAVDRIVWHGDPRSAELEGFRLPEPPSGITEVVDEYGVRYEADVSGGHKSGLFLDQRDNRRLLSTLAADKRVLDICCNAGGFSLHAAKGGASKITAVDLDEKALARAKKNARLNDARVAWTHADLFPFLREARDAKHRWDVVVLDPHKLATGKGEVQQGLAKYRDMNQLAFNVVAPGGLLLTFSCSGAVTRDAFEGVVAAAAEASGREARVLRTLEAAPDHPVSLDFSEGRYLKGLLVHVT